jgi:hypothetical protein
LNENVVIIWSTYDPLRRKVVFDSDAKFHILEEHKSQLGDHVDSNVRTTVEYPQAIYKSKKFPDKELYFKLGVIPHYPNLYLTVVVAHNDNMGTVITAYPQRKISGVNPGGVIYVSK